MTPFALFGAAGAIGRSIAEELRRRNIRYRVVGRHRDRLEADFGGDPLAEIVTWNPDDPTSIRTAAEGVETLIYLVGVPYDHFELHPILMERTVEAAVSAGVRQ